MDWGTIALGVLCTVLMLVVVAVGAEFCVRDAGAEQCAESCEPYAPKVIEGGCCCDLGLESPNGGGC